MALGPEFARNFVPGFVETEATILGLGHFAYASGLAAVPAIGKFAAVATKSPASMAAIALASGAVGYFVGDAVESVVTEATGSRGLGVAPGLPRGRLAGAATGALLGAAIGSIVPGVGTAIGAAVGAIAGAIGGFIGSYW